MAAPDGRAAGPLSCSGRATLAELVAARAAHPESRLLGGGTDLLVNIRRGIVAPPVLIDINACRELREIRADGAAPRDRRLGDACRSWPRIRTSCALSGGGAGGRLTSPGRRIATWARSAAISALDTRCIFYNQSEWWRDGQSPLPEDDRRHLPRGAEKPRRVLCHIQRRSCAGAARRSTPRSTSPGPPAGERMPLADLYIGYARQDEPVTETRGDGKIFPGAAARRDRHRGARRGTRRTCARPTTRSVSAARSNIRSRASRSALRRDGDTLADLRVAFTGTNPRPVRLAGTAEAVRRSAR